MIPFTRPQAVRRYRPAPRALAQRYQCQELSSVLLPFISVVIPTRNRGPELLRCLRSLSAQEYPPDRVEIIVVNDGGQLSHTASLTAGLFSVTVLSQPHAGPAAARNRGAAVARGELLAFTDDDCLATPGWLLALSQRLQASPSACVGGQTHSAADDPYALASDSILRFFGNLEWSPWGFPKIPTTENLALSAERFRAAGGFDESFVCAGGEDRDFFDRWLLHGGQLQFAPEACVFHSPKSGLPLFLERHFRYGRGAYRFSLTRLHRGGPALAPQKLSRYWDLLRSLPASNLYSRLVLSMLVIASQSMTVCGYLYQRLTPHQSSPSAHAAECP